MWNKLWNWYGEHPKNRFWFTIGVIGFVLIAPVLTCTAPMPITWVAILVNAGIAVVYGWQWMKLKRGSKS
jgi:hypothetical protein